MRPQVMPSSGSNSFSSECASAWSDRDERRGVAGAAMQLSREQAVRIVTRRLAKARVRGRDDRHKVRV